jgi:tetratricopeptide (TPR) repeat protein
MKGNVWTEAYLKTVHGHRWQTDSSHTPNIFSVDGFVSRGPRVINVCPLSINYAETGLMYSSFVATCIACLLKSEKPTYTRVLDCCKEAISRVPNNDKAHYRMGVALYNLKRYSDACESLQKAEKLQGKPGIMLHYLLNFLINVVGQVVHYYKRVIFVLYVITLSDFSVVCRAKYVCAKLLSNPVEMRLCSCVWQFVLENVTNK